MGKGLKQAYMVEMAGFTLLRVSRLWSLPQIMIMKHPFPGCCFLPMEYLMEQVEQDFARLEFRPGPLLDFILIMRAGDGSNDAKNPMFNECYNLP